MSTSENNEREPAVSRFHGAAEPLNPLSLLARAADSTGIKAEGEGGWNARKHGGSKRRIWRKIHMGIDEETLEVRAVEITTSNIGDAPMLPELLNQIPLDQDIGSVTADGAYDTRKCHEAIAVRDAHAVIPSAKTQSPGRRRAPELLREMKRSMRSDIWVAPCGDVGADTTAEAASKQNLSGSCYA